MPHCWPKHAFRAMFIWERGTSSKAQAVRFNRTSVFLVRWELQCGGRWGALPKQSIQQGGKLLVDCSAPLMANTCCVPNLLALCCTTHIISGGENPPTSRPVGLHVRWQEGLNAMGAVCCECE